MRSAWRQAIARDYHISPSGDDRAPGTETAPWRTLARAQEAVFAPGDQLRLDSSAPHHGTLTLREQRGAPGRPIVITAYGADQPAMILADDGIGLLLWNCSGIHAGGLHIKGAGYPRSQTHGVCLFADEPGPEAMNLGTAGYGNRHGDITLENIEVERFGCAGVSVGGKADFGFRGVRIRRVKAHDNAYAGIFVWGPGEEHAHEDITVDACEAYDNRGVPGLLHINGHGHHSGHGILLACVSSGSIENSRAYRNGSGNTSHVCGPAGIWASNSRRIVIRRNESFENRTAGATDGGGFGFDGGMQDSVMEDNLSHGNDGSGFLMAQYYGAKPFSGNRFVRNVSRNDGLHNDNGAIHVWGPQEVILRDLLIEGNRVECSASRRGRPIPFYVDAVTENLRLLGNSFAAGDGVPLLIQVSPLQHQLTVSGNRVVGSGSILWRGQVYEEVAGWLKAFPQ